MRKITLFASFLLIALTLGCQTEQFEKRAFDLQGHRGARGLMPENSVSGFIKAVDLGVTTLEMDVVVTADSLILLSHEPWFHHEISTGPDGLEITEENEMEHNIFDMTYEQTLEYDVGLKEHPRFPGQEKLEAQKPLLRTLIDTIEAYTDSMGLEPLQYNIETKSNPEYYGEYVPQPSVFARLLNDLLLELDEEHGMLDRIIIQSFDPQTLIEFRKLSPEVDQAMLIAYDQSMEDVISILGYTPEIWSPNYRLVDREMIENARKNGMAVIPWTVNRVDEMKQLLDIGVDGIITDYPDSAVVLLAD
ncbi:MAG: glycerophosphodiester phosphodiesterase [Bacteroidetes bacterium]|jgi:glycerophosphoryl diester phosphodiesterase|nr:glycerophosphodiester phosphodiesterase [Bacteroidota bacterium]